MPNDADSRQLKATDFAAPGTSAQGAAAISSQSLPQPQQAPTDGERQQARDEDESAYAAARPSTATSEPQTPSRRDRRSVASFSSSRASTSHSSSTGNGARRSFGNKKRPRTQSRTQRIFDRVQAALGFSPPPVASGKGVRHLSMPPPSREAARRPSSSHAGSNASRPTTPGGRKVSTLPLDSASTPADSSAAPTPDTAAAAGLAAAAALCRPALKVRLCTFNMHDSTPSGDLSDFLGSISREAARACGARASPATNATAATPAIPATATPATQTQPHMGSPPQQQVPGTPRSMSAHSLATTAGGNAPSSAGTGLGVTPESEASDDEDSVPNFGLAPAHPYHLIAVAGQECPSSTGVLNGRRVVQLGGKSWTRVLEDYLGASPQTANAPRHHHHYFHHHHHHGKGVDADAASISSLPVQQSAPADRNKPLPYPAVAQPETLPGPRPEDAVATGGAAPPVASSDTEPRQRPISADLRDQQPLSQQPLREGDTEAMSDVDDNARPGGWRDEGEEDIDREEDELDEDDMQGPYVLVDKVRLMGIYCAVFCARSCAHLIRGKSKARVPAGLLNGRVGNKGGVGISVNFAGSRLLFISAHLAAHESGLALRKGNVLKIRDELDVDDFAGNDKKPGQTIFDRFDQIFFMGDLNYRLSISRLHADWLIKQQDFRTALEFDQLRKILADPTDYLGGFQEGPIKHAPTFKYDVLPRAQVKRRRSFGAESRTEIGRRLSNKDQSKPPGTVTSAATPALAPTPGSPLRNDGSAALEGDVASDPEVHHDGPRSPNPGGVDDDDDSDDQEDALSILSTTSAALSDEAPLKATREEYSALGLSMPSAKGGETGVDQIRRTQINLLARLRATSFSKQQQDEAGVRKRPRLPTIQTYAAPKQAGSRTDDELFDVPGSPGSPRSPLMPFRPLLRSAVSDVQVPTRSRPTSLERAPDMQEPARPAAVFDTSSKQRVQSYTDRILFRSNVKPPAPPPPRTPPAPSRSSSFRRQMQRTKSHSAVSAKSDDTGHMRFGRLFPLHRRSTADLSRLSHDDATNGQSTSGAPTPHPLSQASDSRRASFASSPSPNLSPQLAEAMATTAGSSIDSTPTSSPMLGSSPQLDPPASFEQSPPRDVSPKQVQPPPLAGRAGKPRSASFAAQMLRDEPERPPTGPRIRRLDSEPLKFDVPMPPRRTSYDAAIGDDDADSATGNPFSFSSLFSGSHSRRPSTSQPNAAVQGGRLRSFLHMIPHLPFFGRTVSDSTLPTGAATPTAQEDRRVGPQKGEIEVLDYNAVTDLYKMQAFSDHHPVVASLAVGLGDPDPQADSVDDDH